MGALGEDRYAQLLDGLYASALGNQSWLEALSDVRNAFDARSAQLFTGRSVNGTLDFPFSVRSFAADAPDLDSGALFSQNWGGFDLGTDPRMLHAASLSEGELYCDYQFISEDEISRHPFYQDFLNQFETRYHLGVNLNKEPDQIVAMTLNWESSQGHATNRETDLLSKLVPHIQRAYRMSETLSQVSTEKDLLLRLLDQTATGVALLGRSGNVLEINGKLEQIARDKDGINISRSRIWLNDRSMQSRFEKYVSSPLNRLGMDPAPMTDAIVRRPSGKRPYLVNVVPVRVSDLTLTRSAALVLSVVDPAVGATLSLDLMQQYFHMTLAEAKVAVGIGSGLSVEELAHQNGVTIQTVRSQLKSVFVKTDTHRQSELASLLGRLPSALSLDHQD